MNNKAQFVSIFVAICTLRLRRSVELVKGFSTAQKPTCAGTSPASRNSWANLRVCKLLVIHLRKHMLFGAQKLLKEAALPAAVSHAVMFVLHPQLAVIPNMTCFLPVSQRRLSQWMTPREKQQCICWLLIVR